MWLMCFQHNSVQTLAFDLFFCIHTPDNHFFQKFDIGHINNSCSKLSRFAACELNADAKNIVAHVTQETLQKRNKFSLNRFSSIVWLKLSEFLCGFSYERIETQYCYLIRRDKQVKQYAN